MRQRGTPWLIMRFRRSILPPPFMSIWSNWKLRGTTTLSMPHSMPSSMNAKLLPASGIETKRGGPMTWLFAIAGVIIAGLHLYAGFFPTGMNWGVHLLGFFPTFVKLLIPILMIALVIPRIQEFILRVIQKISGAVQRRSKFVRIVLVVFVLAALVVLFWIGRE